MIGVAGLAVVALVGMQVSLQQAEPGVQPVLEVFARQYGQDGRAGGSAGDTGVDGASGYVWSDDSLCSLGASDGAPAGKPAIAWRYSVRVLSRTETELNVQYEYSRLWGSMMGGGGRRRVPLNERVELDRVTAAAGASCQAATLRLEMSMVMRSPSDRIILSPGLSGRGGGGSGSGSGGRGGGGGGFFRDNLASTAVAAGGSGARSGAVAAPQTDQEVWRAKFRELVAAQRQSASQDLIRTLTEELSQLATRPLLDAEVWLVQKLANGGESVQKRQVSFAIAAPFTFDPVIINGGLNIQVSGILRMNPSAVSPLTVEIRRRVKGDGPPRVDNEGGSFQTMELPKPDDVLSFELPPSGEAGRMVRTAPEFSLRLRLSQR
jgi:hypothetical protein